MSPRSLRAATIFIGLACALAALIGWSQSWYSVSLTGLFEGHPTLAVGGDVSAPAVAALALASAAGFAAIAISGRFFRVVLALLEFALGASILFSAIVAVASPLNSVAAAVTDATGLAGTDAVSQLVASITASVWPYVTLVAGSMLALVGVVILVAGHTWPQSGRRYEPVRFEPADDEKTTANDAAVSHWDELSGGSDPTSR